MRVIVFFDLPVDSAEDRREYRHFRRALIKSGFIMLQESVYCKMVLNQNIAVSVSASIRRVKPPKGVVQILTITERQFSKIEYITGNFETDVVSDDRRLIVL